MLFRTQVLILLILAQVWLSMPHFVFELRVKTNSVTTESVCDFRGTSECETYFSVFCLREGRENSQSTDENDCPLGKNTERFNAYLGNQPNNIVRRIASQRPWPVKFQLYIKARDADTSTSDDDLDNIIINRALEVNTGYTAVQWYTGIEYAVSFQARFRVMCEQDYYGADCSTHCVAKNNDVDGHYTCNRQNGSIQCREGFENPSNNCRDMIMINPCNSNPCANNGSCVPGTAWPFHYMCQCAAGYTGRNCEANIDDCRSAICPNNSTCVDGIDGYKCVCDNPNFTLEEDRCIQIHNQRTPITPNGAVFTTDGASRADSDLSGNKNTSPRRTVAIAVTMALIGTISLVIFIVVLVVAIIKWRGKKTHTEVHREGMSARMMDNPTYDYGQLSTAAESATANVIYESPKNTSLGATVHIVDNPMYGEDTGYSPVNDDIVIHDVQNPIYGDS